MKSKERDKSILEYRLRDRERKPQRGTRRDGGERKIKRRHEWE